MELNSPPESVLLPDPSVVRRRPQLPERNAPAVLLLDKPKGWSSFDVVRKIRRVLSEKKVGHAGTLDPMATGMLICLVGRATRLSDALMGLDKEYEGVIRIGQKTPSYDAETPVVEEADWRHITDVDLEHQRLRFIGALRQRPPMYSAIHVQGERLYKKARRGETIEVPERDVTVYAFDLLERNGPDVRVRVRCSKGTYIRSLAHDFGMALGVGGHLVELRRTRIGPFRIEDAWTPVQLEQALNAHSDG